MEFINNVIIDNLDNENGVEKIDKIEFLKVSLRNISYDDTILIKKADFEAES